MKRLLIPLFLPLTALAQQTTAPRNESSFATILATWLPFLFLIGLWWYFMKAMTGRGRGAYSAYIRALPEKMERIEAHLADIAESLRKIADAAERQR